MDFDFSRNHFALFGLAEHYHLNLADLDMAFRALQSRFHPDRSASLPAAQQRLSLQIATRINEAYQTLKQPLARARYLLTLRGVDTGDDTRTALPHDFLLAQMEWRERIADAAASGSQVALENLAAELGQEIHGLENELGRWLDTQPDLEQAANTVRALRFLAKLDEDIHQRMDSLDD